MAGSHGERGTRPEAERAPPPAVTDPAPAAFFDPASLGALRRAPGCARIDGFDAFPATRAVLERLVADGVRLGVIVPDEAPGSLGPLLEQAGLGGLIAPDLVFDGADKLPHRFARAVQAAGHADDPSRCGFVAEDRDVRREALRAGLRVAPHPRLAAAALRRARLRYVRVEVPAEHVAENWHETMLGLELVPLHVAGEHGAVVYAVATAAAAARLDDLGFQVYRLGAEDEPLTTEIYVLRDDHQTRSGFLSPEGESSRRFGTDDEEAERILASTRQGLYVAVVAGRSVESYHFEEARHGHTEKLLPAIGLLRPLGQMRATAALTSSPPEPALTEEERRALQQITPDRMAADIARYAGDQPLDDSGSRIASRHIFNAGNRVALRALADELEGIGDGDLRVGVHPFTHEGRALQNLEAQLSGAELDELVLVTAHLDSTAAFSEGYDPHLDRAPGADDDASGTVGVLAVARAFCALRKLRAPKRTIRFVLFNAEEHGLVGSKAYARDQAALGASIVAVFQMDMIGYNRDPPPTFEVHAGFLPSEDIQQRSLVLAERVGRAAAVVSPGLPPPQIYLSKSPRERDPAEGRSDHASFHLVGYAACATTEDFFAGPGPDSPSAEPNPNYHLTSDTYVDPAYAADLARAVGAAAWLTANL